MGVQLKEQEFDKENKKNGFLHKRQISEDKALSSSNFHQTDERNSFFNNKHPNELRGNESKTNKKKD